MEWALNEPNLWNMPELLFPPFKDVVEFRECGFPDAPHEVFWDQKLNSGSTYYSIIVASDFLHVNNEKHPNELGNRRINIKILKKLFSFSQLFPVQNLVNNSFKKRSFSFFTHFLPIFPTH